MTRLDGWKRIPSVGAVIAFLSLASSVYAVCQKPDPKVCGEFFRSDAVFTGTVLSERTVPLKGDLWDGWLYRLRVSRVFRGSLGRSVRVFTENASARLNLEVGKEYLLFAHVRRGRLVIDSCGNSGLVAETTEKVRATGALQRAQTASIEGHVAARPEWTGVAGIRLRISGKGAALTPVTDSSGWFRVAVPPGKYSVLVESGTATPFDLSYDDPSRLVVRKGQCALVQFVADRP